MSIDDVPRDKEHVILLYIHDFPFLKRKVDTTLIAPKHIAKPSLVPLLPTSRVTQGKVILRDHGTSTVPSSFKLGSSSHACSIDPHS